MAGSNSHTTVLILNVHGLNAPIKRHRLANQMKTEDPLVCLGDPSHTKTHIDANKGMEEYLPSKWKAKKSRVFNPSL